ncbi:probable serine/threonine-protein kinase at1g18390 [Phtheirospermum japonicum]|uniref:Probable serine/threonine-protein kinase at1g18390 n=1 Tax=Phtheirospermum japonicum TaxID=374723 RepID=A0A830CFA0_9LAMI|nr:probable serine/threonine-protein kinase at1g18390 [Phtheirospermum japonicum]
MFMKYMPLLIIIITLLLITNSNSRRACLPQTCNGLNIKSPFWIPGPQDPGCGWAGFNVSCNDNKPVIKINGDDFVIINIFYKNESFLLARRDVFGGVIRCPTPQRNFSVSGTRFSYGPATSDLFFFYNCTAPFERQTYGVDCASDAGRHSFAVFHVELLRHWNYSVESCGPPVNAAVEDGGLDELLRMNYTTILKKGFVLQWSCSGCAGRGLNSKLKIDIGVGASALTAIALEKSTHHFNPKSELGDGGYGAVYKGKLTDGRVVAVKRLYENHNRRVEQFMNEVEILARLRHQNLVSLYGCTSRYSKELLLVYEYIPNGTLADHLHGPRSGPGSPSWAARLNIAVETASALSYLHASGVIHRDVKSSNILLDNNFTVKVADFGLSRLVPVDVTHVSTGPQGTPGYVDPEYNEYYQLTEKSDVYSFGVVLIELISSKTAVDITRQRDEINLSTMAIGKIRNDALHELVDEHIGFDSDCNVRGMIIGVAELAFRCLQNTRDMRPHMEDVLSILEEIRRGDYSTDVINVSSDIDIPLVSGEGTK